MTVIELEHHDVCLTAIHAGMCGKASVDQDAVLDLMVIDPRDLMRGVDVAAVEVVLPAVGGVAGATVRLKLTRRERAKGEVGRGLVLMTHAADGHGAPLRSASRAPSAWPCVEHVFYQIRQRV